MTLVVLALTLIVPTWTLVVLALTLIVLALANKTIIIVEGEQRNEIIVHKYLKKGDEECETFIKSTLSNVTLIRFPLSSVLLRLDMHFLASSIDDKIMYPKQLLSAGLLALVIIFAATTYK